MLLATIEGETPKVDEEILKWQMPALWSSTAAGAIPGAGDPVQSNEEQFVHKNFLASQHRTYGKRSGSS